MLKADMGVMVALTRGEIISLLKDEDARPTTLNEELKRSAKAKLQAALDPCTPA